MSRIFIESPFALVAIAMVVWLGVPVRAQQLSPKSSTRIVAFGDDASAKPPAEHEVVAERVKATPPPAKVLVGAVIPPAPRVAISASAAGRPYTGRGMRLGSFTARPAAATRLSVNSPFGVRQDPLTGLIRMHTGVDLKADFGESVGVSMSGTVWFAGQRAGYGNLVIVDHGSGIATFYAHLSRIDVTVGQTLDAGQLIGYVGSTGRSTGPHLHYEVRANGRPIDPSSAIDLANDQLVVNGQSVGAASSESPASLPKAPGGTSISVEFDETAGTTTLSSGQVLAVDWE